MMQLYEFCEGIYQNNDVSVCPEEFLKPKNIFEAHLVFREALWFIRCTLKHGESGCAPIRKNRIAM